MNWKPITEEEYDSALGALPPRVHLHNAFLLGEAHDWRLCSVTQKVTDTFRPYAQINGAFYKGDPVTAPEFVTARTKGFAI